MDNDLRWFLARLGLKPDAQPAVGVIMPGITAGNHGIGKDKKPVLSPRAFPSSAPSAGHIHVRAWSPIAGG